MEALKQERTAAFTPAEIRTIQIIKEQAIRSPKIAEVFQDIIAIFSAIRSQIAELDTPDSKIRIEISINTKDQVIRLHLHEEITKVRSRIMRAFSILSSSSDIHSQSLVFSRKGFAHRSIPPAPTNNNNAQAEEDLDTRRSERNECLHLLEHFYEKLNVIAQELLK